MKLLKLPPLVSKKCKINTSQICFSKRMDNQNHGTSLTAPKFDTKFCTPVTDLRTHQQIFKRLSNEKQLSFMPEGLPIQNVKKELLPNADFVIKKALFIVSAGNRIGALNFNPTHPISQEIGRSENGTEIRFNPVLGMVPAEDGSNAHYVAFTQCIPKLQPVGAKTPKQPCSIYKVPDSMLRYIRPRPPVSIEKQYSSYTL